MPRHRLRTTGEYAAGIVLFFLVWWGGSALAGSAIVPPPFAVAGYVASRSVLADFAANTALTIARGILGFSAAWVLSVPAAMLVGRRAGADRVAFFPLFLLQGAPPLFWITPLVLWLGTGGLVAPVVAMLVTFPLLTVHAAAALKHIAPYEYDLFTIYAPRSRVIVRELYLPRLLPAIKSNVRLGLLVAIKAAMLAEWFAAQDGFGRRINVFYQFFALKEFMGWALLFLVTIGVLSYAVNRFLERTLPDYVPTPMPRRAGGARIEKAPVRVPQTSAARLDIRRLSFSYDEKPLIRDFSLSVASGRPGALYGRSGCGKTTLLKCISGLVTPQSGEIKRPDNVGLVFQEDVLLAHRDAIGNVLISRLPDLNDQTIESARRSLELWGLKGYENHFPHELSGGMRKRLAMARAWFHDPGVLLLDEPFVNLDRSARAELWDLFFERMEDASIPILIVTHYPEEIERFSVNISNWSDITDQHSQTPG